MHKGLGPCHEIGELGKEKRLTTLSALKPARASDHISEVVLHLFSRCFVSASLTALTRTCRSDNNEFPVNLAKETL